MSIPVSVLIMTRDEVQQIHRCLMAVQAFDEIVVVDSHSRDGTADLARRAGATVIDFEWDGQYPKKRQWALDHLDLKYDWILFIDADEVMTPELVAEIAALFEAGPPCCDGYFVKGLYVRDGRVLRFGLKNNKLTLFDRRKLFFPVVDDLDLPGMGEIEGHYQPVAKNDRARIGQLKGMLLHYAYNDPQGWTGRHRRYAAWEAAMDARRAWPVDPVRWREILKRIMRASALRPYLMFTHSYILKAGMFDGRAGWRLARDRYRYGRMIIEARHALLR